MDLAPTLLPVAGAGLVLVICSCAAALVSARRAWLAGQQTAAQRARREAAEALDQVEHIEKRFLAFKADMDGVLEHLEKLVNSVDKKRRQIARYHQQDEAEQAQPVNLREVTDKATLRRIARERLSGA